MMQSNKDFNVEEIFFHNFSPQMYKLILNEMRDIHLISFSFALFYVIYVYNKDDDDIKLS